MPSRNLPSDVASDVAFARSCNMCEKKVLSRFGKTKCELRVKPVGFAGCGGVRACPDNTFAFEDSATCNRWLKKFDAALS